MNQLSFDFESLPQSPKPVLRLQRWEKHHEGWKGEFTILEERQRKKGTEYDYQCDIYRPDGKWETYLQTTGYTQFAIEREFYDTVDTWICKVGLVFERVLVSEAENIKSIGNAPSPSCSPGQVSINEECLQLIEFVGEGKPRSHVKEHFYNWESERLDSAIAFCLGQGWLETRIPAFGNIAAALAYDEENHQLLVARDTSQAENPHSNVLGQVYNARNAPRGYSPVVTFATAPELSIATLSSKDTAPELSILKQSHWLEAYTPYNRKAKYYRYCYRENGKKKHIHIPGGSTTSALANSRMEMVRGAIALGKASAEIKQLIQDLRGKNDA
jgi:hypothetical protein